MWFWYHFIKQEILKSCNPAASWCFWEVFLYISLENNSVPSNDIMSQVAVWATFIAATQISYPRENEVTYFCVCRDHGSGRAAENVELSRFFRAVQNYFSHLRVFGRHGDMLFLFPSGSPSSSGDVMDTTGPQSSLSLSSPSASASSSLIPRSLSAPQVQEDEIDQYLAKQDGKIYRNKDPQLWETTRHKPPHLEPSFSDFTVGDFLLSDVATAPWENACTVYR